jgi:hypothetical protein
MAAEHVVGSPHIGSRVHKERRSFESAGAGTVEFGDGLDGGRRGTG